MTAEWLGLPWSRLKCRYLDHHDKYCRGRMDHTREQRNRKGKP